MRAGEDTRVLAVHRGICACLLASGAVVSVSRWLDADGEMCPAESAVVAIAGPTPCARWLAIDLRDFPPATIH